MVRYKRRSYGRRRRSTNVIKMKFQSFMDISTSDSSMQIITISAGGPEILRRLAPQFGAYKYYKIGNIACKLVPASTLPVDPTGLSYASGAQTVDPRDQLTPGMMRITNGEDIFEDISGLSADDQYAVYNNMLLDPRWFKWMLQSGVKRHATPRYWQIGQLHQDKWPGSVLNTPYFDSTGANLVGSATVSSNYVQAAGGSISPTVHGQIRAGSSEYGLFQTGHRGVLGWLPTDSLQTVRSDVFGSPYIKDVPSMASPPEVEVMKIILPKAYKTRYYYRMFITETVYFKEPIVNFGIPYADPSGGDDYTVRPLDVFHVPGTPQPYKPTVHTSTTFPQDSQTGGNYGTD